MKSHLKKLWNLGPITRIAVILVGISFVNLVFLFVMLFAHMAGHASAATVSSHMWLFPLGVGLILAAAIMKVIAERLGERELLR